MQSRMRYNMLHLFSKGDSANHVLIYERRGGGGQWTTYALNLSSLASQQALRLGVADLAPGAICWHDSARGEVLQEGELVRHRRGRWSEAISVASKGSAQPAAARGSSV